MDLFSDYPADIRLVFRHFPLTSHPLARISAEASEAAGAQGKFWEMHDQLYSRQDEWGDTTKKVSESDALIYFKAYADTIGLDQAAFAKAMEDNAHQAVISQDMNNAMAAGANATPTFFVNGKIVKEPSYEALKKAVDEALGR